MKKQILNYCIPLGTNDYETLKDRLIQNGFFTDSEIIRPSMCSIKDYVIESNYFRTYRLKYWDNQLVEELVSLIDEVNKQTEEYDFYLYGIDDYEVEFDGDRSYPASYNIISVDKGCDPGVSYIKIYGK